MDPNEKYSAIYDSGILMVTYYHMIEWIKWTILLTMALIDVNLVNVFYFFHLNSIFGLVSMITAVMDEVSSSDD